MKKNNALILSRMGNFLKTPSLLFPLFIYLFILFFTLFGCAFSMSYVMVLVCCLRRHFICC